MPGRPSDARCLSLFLFDIFLAPSVFFSCPSRSCPRHSLIDVSLNVLPFPRLPRNYVRISARIACHKYRSSAIRISGTIDRYWFLSRRHVRSYFRVVSFLSFPLTLFTDVCDVLSVNAGKKVYFYLDISWLLRTHLKHFAERVFNSRF